VGTLEPDGRLKFLSADASLTGSPTSTIALPRPSGLSPWLLDGIACTHALRSLHSEAVALVLVTNLERPVRPAREVLHQLFGFTHTESRLARALLSGESLKAAAARLKISEGHARQRLKSMFSKTATSRQGELILLLGRLA
jgi:DNA-binding CsgD family transcriptional regulator